MKKRIFVVDDEQDIRDILKINLEKEGYSVHCYPSADAAKKALNSMVPDIMLLDIMMEGMDGYEFCRNLRSEERFRHIPVIFLSAKSNELDKVVGLEIGADDYMTKPFSLSELKSRVKAVLRRSAPAAEDRSSGRSDITFKEMTLHPQEYRLTIQNEDVKLTKTEFEILYLFMKNAGKIFTRDNIIDSVKGDDVYVVDRTIDVHIMNLRKKLGPYKQTIMTFSGVGYGFREQ
jgi:two-component system phosphate regulon response regulator PhoB